MMRVWNKSEKKANGDSAFSRHQNQFWSAVACSLFVLCLDGMSLKVRAQEYPTYDSEFENYARDYLINICEPNGKPNPRSTCTNGHGVAIKYVAEELKEMGLVPLGDNGTFVQTIPGSINETWCPPGIANVVGMVRGTTYPDQYVVYMGILNGGYNLNPETYKSRNNDNFSFPYESGMAAAIGLAIARDMSKNPPLRSTIFLFHGGGHGWRAVGERKRGDLLDGPFEQFKKTSWYEGVCQSLAANLVQCEKKHFIGLTYWVSNPPVELSSINIMFVADRMGSPCGLEKNIIFLLGGEQTMYGEEGLTINNFIDEVWPDESNLKLVKGPLAAIDGSQVESNPWSEHYFTSPCGNRCDGLKLAWFMQPAFQISSEKIDDARSLYAKQLGQGEGEDFPAPVYYTTDNLQNVNWEHFGPTATTLSLIVHNTSNVVTENLNFTFNKSRRYVLDREDVDNLVESITVLNRDAVKILPEGIKYVFAGQISTRLEENALEYQMQTNKSSDYLSDEDVQIEIRSSYQFVAGLYMVFDYFNKNYPDSEPFHDQRYGVNIVTQPYPEPSDSTNQPEPDQSDPTILSVTVASAAVVFIIMVAVACFLVRMRKRSRETIHAVAAYPVSPELENAEEVANGDDPIPATVLEVELAPRLHPYSGSGGAPSFTGDIPSSNLAEEREESFVPSLVEGGTAAVNLCSTSDQSELSTRIHPEFKDQINENDCGLHPRADLQNAIPSVISPLSLIEGREESSRRDLVVEEGPSGTIADTVGSSSLQNTDPEPEESEV
jgi:hypothetical protein